MIGQAVGGKRDVLYPRGRTARFGKIARPARPEHIFFPRLDALNIRAQPLIVADGHFFPKSLIAQAGRKPVILAEGGSAPFFHQLLKDRRLRGVRKSSPFCDLVGDKPRDGARQHRFDAHVTIRIGAPQR